MPDRVPIKTVLACHMTPDEIRPVLDSRLKDVAISYLSDPESLPAALEAHQPDAIFSIAQSMFSRGSMRPAIDFPSVRWFHVGGSGYEYIVPWDRERVTVTNGMGILASFLAETALTGMLMLNGNFRQYATQQDAHEWKPIYFTPLQGQTLLIVGLGTIGSLIAKNAKALGMRVLATRRTPAPDPNVDEVHGSDALSDLIGQADFVSLHIRMSDETRGMFDAKMFNAMKPGSFLINTARGPVVQEAALLDALNSGHIAGAYLDVFEHEPLPTDSPLWDQPNVIMTPHAADNVHNWPARFAGFFADNLDRWNRGEELVNIVSQ